MTPQQIREVITDQTALIATLLGEAAKESIEGQIAVACVIRNRAKHPRWWGKTFKGVCLAKAQFSCWWEKNDNTARVYALADALHRRVDATGALSVVGQLHWVAAGVMDDMLLDNTGGADHYHANWMFEKGLPKWAHGRKPVKTIGGHTFYRLEI